MDTNRRCCARLLAVAAAVLIGLAGDARAETSKAYPLLGVEIRNGDTVAFDVGGVAVFGTPAKLDRLLAATVRGDIGVGGAGAGVGLVIASGTDKADPDLRDLLFGGIVLLEARAERMAWSTSWNHTTYVGPQLSFCHAIVPRLSLGWMVDPRDSSDSHLQLGIGAGC